MDVSQFLLLLLKCLSELEFVEKVDVVTEVFILKCRAILKNNRFLQVYFNELTGTIAFALIEKDKRIWGIDCDNMRGWRLHPIENPETHQNIEKTTVDEVIKLLSDIWPSL